MPTRQASPCILVGLGAHSSPSSPLFPLPIITMDTLPAVNIDPLVANMASTHISPPFPPAPAPASVVPPRSSQSVEVNLLNSIKFQLAVSPASPDYAILRAAAVKERSEVNIENSPEEALRREVNALRAARTKHNIALKELVRSFKSIRGMSARIQLMEDRVARMRLDLSAIKRARNAALDSRRAGQAGEGSSCR